MGLNLAKLVNVVYNIDVGRDMDQRRDRYEGLVKAVWASRTLSARRKNFLLRDAALILVGERRGLISQSEADRQYDLIAARIVAAEASGMFRKQFGSKRFKTVLTRAAREMKLTIAG